jgi:hypothetical protein
MEEALEAILRQANPALAYADPIGHVGRLALTFGSRSLPATLSPTRAPIHVSAALRQTRR